MPSKKKKPETVADVPRSFAFETFRNIGAWERGNLTQGEPSCFNSVVSVRKYRVTVEPVDEPAEVIVERIRALWRACDNGHHLAPLRAAAKRYGVELDSAEYGVDRKRS